MTLNDISKMYDLPGTIYELRRFRNSNRHSSLINKPYFHCGFRALSHAVYLIINRSALTIKVGLSGLEPLTPALSAQCSNRLSYRPRHINRSRVIRQQSCFF